MKLLIVDDESAVRQFLGLMLGKTHQVCAVSTVDEALEQLREQTWDVILSDFKMPGKGGLDLVESLDESGYSLPVILMTGQSSQDSKLDLIRTKVSKVLTKPFTPEDLESALEELGLGEVAHTNPLPGV